MGKNSASPLKIETCLLVVIDLQGKLVTLMHESKSLIKQVGILIDSAKTLGIPIVWTEHVPDKLGPTHPDLAARLEGLTPIVKHTFSCSGEPSFGRALKSLKRRQILLTGIETHICVYQTARDLLLQDYEVFVVSDAVSSRSEANWRIGLDRCRDLGTVITSVEMALFEMLGTPDHEAFKPISTWMK